MFKYQEAIETFSSERKPRISIHFKMLLNRFTPKSPKFKTEGKHCEFNFAKLSKTNSTT